MTQPSGVPAHKLAQTLKGRPKRYLEGIWGTVSKYTPGTPNTVDVTFAGSTTTVSGLRFFLGFGADPLLDVPSAGDYVFILKLGDGDYLVLGGMS